MKVKVTWLIVAAVAAVSIVGLVDAVRGSNPKAADAGESVSKPSATTAPPRTQSATESAATTASVTIPQPLSATARATESTVPERLASCDTAQLRLTFTDSEALAAVVLERVKGPPCRHGRALIGFTVRDQSGNRVAVFGGTTRATPPADFSNGYEQLIDLFQMHCDPNGSFDVVATVGPYVVRRTLPGTKLPCDHG